MADCKLTPRERQRYDLVVRIIQMEMAKPVDPLLAVDSQVRIWALCREHTIQELQILLLELEKK